jgi:Invasion associated locus B (IalB) protein
MDWRSVSFFRSAGAAVLATVALAIIGAGGPAARAQGESEPALLQQYGDWSVYTGASGGNKVCFALAQPASAQTEPPNRPRDPIYFFVSTRPAENVRNEVSVIIGYPFRSNSEASVEIGTAKFTLQTQNDNAWLKDQGEESRLVEAMRKGSDLVVKGVSGRGTQTTDRYSLKGISQALDRVGQECR